MIPTATDPRPTAVGLAPVGVAGAAAVAVAFLAVHGPHVAGVTCPSRALTGLDCPGCGSTRSLAALCDGDIARAFDHHLLVPLLVPLLAWVWLSWAVRTYTGRRWSTPLHAVGAPTVVLAVVVVFTVLRNLPGLEWLGSGAG